VLLRSHAPRLLLLAMLLGCNRPGPATLHPHHVELVDAAGGPVDVVVRTSLAIARGDRRRVLVYVSAPWCEPCERFQAAVRAGKLDASFPDLRLLKFDHDRDSGRLAAAGYDGSFIPRFVVPGADGRGTAQRMEGGTKADDTVAGFIAPRLAELLGTPLPAKATP